MCFILTLIVFLYVYVASIAINVQRFKKNNRVLTLEKLFIILIDIKFTFFEMNFR